MVEETLSFDDKMRIIRERCDRFAIPFVQNEDEFRYVHDLIKEAGVYSYLEVGTADGNSLIMFGSLSKFIKTIDLEEAHTKQARINANTILNKNEIVIFNIGGDSTIIEKEEEKKYYLKYDVVYIDGGHDYTTVISDSIRYAPLANKLVLWHDICLPEVRAAYEWFKKRYPAGKYSEYIKSETYGYGILEVGK